MGAFSVWHWLVILMVLVLAGLPNLPGLWVLKRAGRSRWQIIWAFIPLVNIVWLWVIAFGRWPNLEATRTR